MAVMNLAGKIVSRGASAASAQARRNASTITSVKGREVIDSRGNPTVEVGFALHNELNGRGSLLCHMRNSFL